MEEGALALGSSLIHAQTDELVALAREVAGYGGRYISHMRSEGNRLLGAIDELIKIAREARLPAEIYHLKAAGAENWCRAASGADPAAQAGPPRGSR